MRFIASSSISNMGFVISVLMLSDLVKQKATMQSATALFASGEGA